jgi:hypothetical protein
MGGAINNETNDPGPLSMLSNLMNPMHAPLRRVGRALTDAEVNSELARLQCSLPAP